MPFRLVRFVRILYIFRAEHGDGLPTIVLVCIVVRLSEAEPGVANAVVD